MNKKVPIIIIVILGIILLILFITHKDEFGKNKNKNLIDGYVIIGDQSVWKYDGSWRKGSTINVDNLSFDTYIDNVYKGYYTYKYGNTWNLFVSNNFVSYDGDLLGISKNLGTFDNFTVSKVTDSDINKINELLKRNLSLEDIPYSEKVNIDLDNNGYLDSVVYVTNITDDELNNYYNLLYVVLNGKTQVLVNKDIVLKDYYLEPLYSIKCFLSINSMKNINIIIQKGYFSDVNKTGNMLYQLNNGKYKLVIED